MKYFYSIFLTFFLFFGFLVAMNPGSSSSLEQAPINSGILCLEEIGNRVQPLDCDLKTLLKKVEDTDFQKLFRERYKKPSTIAEKKSYLVKINHMLTLLTILNEFRKKIPEILEVARMLARITFNKHANVQNYVIAHQDIKFVYSVEGVVISDLDGKNMKLLPLGYAISTPAGRAMFPYMNIKPTLRTLQEVKNDFNMLTSELDDLSKAEQEEVIFLRKKIITISLVSLVGDWLSQDYSSTLSMLDSIIQCSTYQEYAVVPSLKGTQKETLDFQKLLARFYDDLYPLLQDFIPHYSFVFNTMNLLAVSAHLYGEVIPTTVEENQKVCSYLEIMHKELEASQHIYDKLYLKLRAFLFVSLKELSSGPARKVYMRPFIELEHKESFPDKLNVKNDSSVLSFASVNEPVLQRGQSLSTQQKNRKKNIERKKQRARLLRNKKPELIPCEGSTSKASNEQSDSSEKPVCPAVSESAKQKQLDSPSSSASAGDEVSTSSNNVINDYLMVGLKKYYYSQTLYAWFDKKKQALMSPKPNAWSLLYHTFNPALDSLILQKGIKEERRDKTTHYFLRGEIIYPSKSTCVVFYHLICNKNKIFHRGLINNINEKFEWTDSSHYDIHFPSLAKNIAIEQIPEELSSTFKNNSVCDKNRFYLKFPDTNNNVELIAYLIS